ncbi:STN domain-containing protein [Fibrella sp. HMF5335]|uniref:STN domain-containing protein n=1 Tax=Fibrella rubiginis TaxID=2817060 RepID=A0A939K1L2_9BACT|nr:STN domain-containing protein [Fibrella rubiginis]MBO0935364.1 STN domain-containing protein [Fibrella rubiginis]
MTAFRTILLVIGLLVSVLSEAQTRPPLERLISLNLRNESLEQALTAISRAGQFSFSYNPTLLTQRPPVTLRVVNRPVREVLGQLFGGSVRVRVRGNHVILLKADEPAQPKDFILDGYIIDSETAARIGAVTLFERTSLRSAVSNGYGYYRLKLPTVLPTIRLEVRRETYVNRSLTVSTRRTQPLNIYLTLAARRVVFGDSVPRLPLVADQLPVHTGSLTDTTLISLAATYPLIYPSTDSATVVVPPSFLARTRRRMGRWALSAKQLITDINLDRDTLYRTWQVSFLPTLGSNRALDGRIINDYSLNMLVGYSLGVRKLELGGLYNIVRQDVQGVQLSGFGNLVGGNTRGVQLAGFLNTNQGNVDPLQAAGFLNLVGGNVRGVQLAGFLNVVRRNVVGMQAAGFTNIAPGDMAGVQLAGFSNHIAGTLRGWQVSGFLNYADTVARGGQLGFINVANVSKRVPIGFFSYVKQGGYRDLSLSANEVTTLNVSFRTGVQRFYNIFTAGLNPATNVWSFGYGLGTRTTEFRGWSLALEGFVHQLNRVNEPVAEENRLLRLSPLLTRQLAGRLSFSVGPTLNAYHPTNRDRNALRGITLPALLVSSDPPANSRTQWTGWLGWQGNLAVRL